MKKLFLISLVFFIAALLQAQPFERYHQNQSYDYPSLIEEYQKLDAQFESAKLLSIGKTDVGKDLHVFIINSDASFDFEEIANGRKAVVLINNAIHPGEPCGVDASLKLSWQLLNEEKQMLKNVVVAIIPMYNVGGGLNRACCSRANQNGPEEAGFRGNARNLDLNRDFIKADAQNTWAFQKLYQEIDPDVFIDTHTSNGADYSYTMTLIASQHNKLHQVIGSFQKNRFEPALYNSMQEKDLNMCPYVHSLKGVPDSGIVEFLETPRYSTGYSAQFHSFGFVTEAHMLKSFEQRVIATYEVLLSILEFSARNAEEIIRLRKEAFERTMAQRSFPLNYVLDDSESSSLMFNGYEAKYKKSEVTGEDRLYYDQNAPYQKPIKFYDNYSPSKTVIAPTSYVIPQVWADVIERLKHNGVVLNRIDRDTQLLAEVYYIEDYETVKQPYEGHYLHYNTKLKTQSQTIQLFEGDFIVNTNQRAKRFIVEVLEPEAVDSYFSWNFFDEILQQKEWFSAYVFEDRAVELLKEDADLKKRFEQKKKEDQEFAKNPRAQLFFIYKNSHYYENSHLRYPIYRLN